MVRLRSFIRGVSFTSTAGNEGDGLVGRTRAFGGEPSGANQAVPDGVAHQPGGLVDVELLHDAIAVRLGSLEGNAEQLGDRLRGLALGDQLQDLAFARRNART